MNNLGVWIAVGAAIGVSLMAATGEAYWIAVGAGIGVAMGVAMQSMGRDSDEGGDESQ